MSDGKRTKPRIEFVPIDGRRFITITADLTEGVSDPGSGTTNGRPSIPSVGESPGSLTSLDETDQIAAAIAEHLPLTDAIARLDIRATQEQWDRVRHNEHHLTALLTDVGLHRLYGGFQATIVRPPRKRVASFDAALSDREILDAWCDEQPDVDEVLRRGLHELLAGSREASPAGEAGAGGVFVPVSLTAENVGRYASLHHVFEEGATVLVGENGAGKSVILRCVELALYANGARDLKRELAPWADSLRIELVFTLDGVLHRVRRSYSRGGGAKLDLERFEEALVLA